MTSLRLKKVQGKKKRDTAARDAAQKVAEPPSTVDQSLEAQGEAESVDLLSSKDADVIF
jgi:V-type H+-transporting ATPase subunit D